MSATRRIRVRDRWLVAVSLVGFVLICLAVHARHVTSGGSQSPIDGGGLPGTVVHPAKVTQDTSRDRPWFPSLHVGLHGRLPLTQVLAALGLVALIVIIVRFRPRLRRVARAPERSDPVVVAAPDADVVSQAGTAIDLALASVRRGDGEDAIIECWLSLEQLVAAAGVTRGRSETSAELVRRMLAVLPVRAAPLTELAELYREARYSTHPMDAAAVDRAQRALAALSGDLVPGAVRG